MDSLRLCLSCAGRKPGSGGGGGSGGHRGSRRDGQQQQQPPVIPSPSPSVASVSDDSLEKVLEHAAKDNQPDTPGYWRNRGIGDVDTPPIRRRVLLLPPPPPSCSSSSNSIISVDYCTTRSIDFIKTSILKCCCCCCFSSRFGG